jgi:hypothetical protein
MKANIKL